MGSLRNDVVTDGQHSRLGVQFKSAPVKDWIWQSSVPVVFGNHFPSVDPWRPENAPRPGAFTPEEWPEHDRLIEVVDHNRVVRACAAEVVPPRRKAEIVVGPWVDEDVASERAQGEAERIGMAVGRNRLEAQVSAIEHDAYTVGGPPVTALEQVIAGLGSRARREKPVRWRWRQCIDLRPTRAAQQPSRGFRMAAGPGFEICATEDGGADTKERMKFTAPAEVEHVAIIAVAQHRRPRPAFGQGAEELQHSLETRPVRVREIPTHLARDDAGQEEELEHEHVIADRLLAASAIGISLREDFFLEDPLARAPPLPRVVEVAKVARADEDAGRLADPVVVGGRATRVLPCDLQ